MELTEIESLLDAKINPLIDTIRKLEQSQEKIIDVMMAQSRMSETLLNLEKSIDNHFENSTSIHDHIFDRIRTLDEHKECRIVAKEFNDRMSKIEEKKEDRLWSVIQLFIAGVIGGMFGWIIDRWK